MAKVNSFLWAILVLYLVMSTRVFATEFFSDDFNGTTLNESKWMASVDPPRFRQYGGSDDPSGEWVTPDGNPSYGTVSVSDSRVSLWNNHSSVFPYVVSQNNPFPETGDFVLEFKMKYDSVNPQGTGFVVRYADSESPFTNPIFSVWQDSSTTDYLTAGLFGSIPWRPSSAWQGQISDTNDHVYMLKYISGEYTVLIDETEIIGPIANLMRPNQIWFGNPCWAWWTQESYATFNVDYITVAPEPATLFLLGFGSLALLRKRRV
jgi:hypothetical protein